MAIEDVYLMGDDALGNQFALTVTPILGIVPDQLRFRVLTVDIPEKSMGTYEVPTATQKFTKPNGKIETSNEFSFTFRIDKYWGIYKTFQEWMDYIVDPETGLFRPDVSVTGQSQYRTDIFVNTLDGNLVPTSSGWKMMKAFPTSLSGVSFDVNSGDPLEASVTMNFLKMTTPFDS